MIVSQASQISVPVPVPVNILEESHLPVSSNMDLCVNDSSGIAIHASQMNLTLISGVSSFRIENICPENEDTSEASSFDVNANRINIATSSLDIEDLSFDESDCISVPDYEDQTHLLPESEITFEPVFIPEIQASLPCSSRCVSASSKN